MIEAPIRVISEANQWEHWGVRAKRHRQQRVDVRGYWRMKAPRGLAAELVVEPPRCIRLTRFSPRKLDSDNLPVSFKAIRDELADLMVFNDGDERCTWLYAQESRKHPGIRIEVWP